MKSTANLMGITPSARTSSIRKWSLAGLAAAAAMVATNSIQAAPITWGTVTNITGLATDVSTTGTLVPDSALTGTTDVTKNVTVNSVPFVAGLIWPPAGNGASLGNRVPAMVGTTTMDTNYRVLLQSNSYGGGTHVVTLSGLTIGKQYQVQVWASDNAQTDGVRTTVLDDTAALYIETTLNSWGQFVIGTFTADETTQLFTAQGYNYFGGVTYSGGTGTQALANMSIAGIQVRDLTPNTDFTAPTWVATWPQVNSVTITSFTASAKINEAGNAFFVVLPGASAAPTSAQVKAGNDSSNAPALKNGNIVLTANTENSAAVTGLALDTDYDVWFVAQDVVFNLQATPSKVSFHTLADSIPPTLVTFTDDKSGGPINVPTTVLYTVTFSEPMKVSTVGAGDFETVGSAAATINGVSVTANPAIFTVSVTATGPGNLLLQIAKDAELLDLGDNPLNTSSALPAATTIVVNPDSTPPTPGTMTFSSPPSAVATTVVTMTAATATDPSGVEYYFTCTAGAGHNSGWQGSPTYFDIGLTANTAYAYTVKARDKSAAQNQTLASTPAATSTPSTSAAGVITWGSSINISGAASDVTTAGSLVTGSALTGTTDVTKDVTVNTVPFVAGLLWPTATGSASSGRVAPTNGTTTMDSDYRTLLLSESYQNAENTVTLSGLTAGQPYAVQAWVSDSAQTAGKSSTVLDGTRALYWEAGAEGAWGQYAIGTFTASSSTQTFTTRGFDFFGDVDYAGNLATATTRNTFLCGVQLRKLSVGTSGYDVWGAPYGLSAGSEGGDLDNDGLTNFDEYAFGLLPNNGASVNPIAVPLNKSAGTFSYTRRTQSLTGLSYKIRSSTTLAPGSWTTLVKDTDYTESVTGAGEVKTVQVTLTPAPTAPKWFVQVTAQ